MANSPLARMARVAGSWNPQERDAVLYAGSALFAITTAQASSIPLYQQWGRLAVGPYAFGALASALAVRYANRRRARLAQQTDQEGRAQPVAASSGEGGPGWHWTGPRALIFLVVLVGATLLPLSLEVLWRTDSGGATHVQPEVAVVEQSAHAFFHGHDPYQRITPHSHPKPPPGEPAYDAYNPYLPLMSLFGGPRTTHAPLRLTDARVAFSMITILVVIAALALCRGPTGPRVLALQSMTVLPTAALPLATGGDDLPIAALMLLGLVLLQRRRPLAAGITLGVASSMKITAWPLTALAFLAARDREGERGRRPKLLVLAGIAGVMIPAVVPTAAANLPAFIDNVVRFPLGLSGVSSPAGSPLIGHVVVSIFPGFHRAFTILVAAVGLAAMAYVLVRHRPRTPAALSRLIGWVMLVAILLAPATRVGYLLYPLDFFVWAWLLKGEELADALGIADASRALVRAAHGTDRARPAGAPGDGGDGHSEGHSDGGSHRPGDDGGTGSDGEHDAPHRRVSAAVGTEPLAGGAAS